MNKSQTLATMYNEFNTICKLGGMAQVDIPEKDIQIKSVMDHAYSLGKITTDVMMLVKQIEQRDTQNRTWKDDTQNERFKLIYNLIVNAWEDGNETGVEPQWI